MPAQLWSTTLDPETRTLRRLTLEDAAEASHTFGLLMGDKVGSVGRCWSSTGRTMHLSIALPQCCLCTPWQPAALCAALRPQARTVCCACAILILLSNR